MSTPVDELEFEPTLGPCGCVDYHMADCDIVVRPINDDLYWDDIDWAYKFWDDDYDE